MFSPYSYCSSSGQSWTEQILVPPAPVQFELLLEPQTACGKEASSALSPGRFHPMAASTGHWQPSLINWREVSPLRPQGTTASIYTHSFLKGSLIRSQVLHLILHSVLSILPSTHPTPMTLSYSTSLYISMPWSMRCRLRVMAFATWKIPTNSWIHTQVPTSLHRFSSPSARANSCYSALFAILL